MTVARIKYGKGNELKYISHLDFMRSVHRMLNRAGIEVAHSQGFNPHPKVSFAMAMPVGMTSEGEYLDVELTTYHDRDSLMKVLKENAPRGLDIFDIKIYETTVKSLTAFITDGIFIVEMPLGDNIDEEEIKKIIIEIMKEEKIELTKKNKKGILVLKNIRPLIKQLDMLEVKDNTLKLKMVISIGSTENLNPQMLINYIIKKHSGFKEIPYAKIHRLDMIVSENKTPIDL